MIAMPTRMEGPASVTLYADREQIAAACYADEKTIVPGLLETLKAPDKLQHAALRRARAVTQSVRDKAPSSGTLDSFLGEFGLSSADGIALMCLAEALLRIPDPATADAFIAEILTAGEWRSHIGRAESVFVNASIWALMLAEKITESDHPASDDPTSWMGSLIARVGEPVIRAALKQAMSIIGEQFVFAANIDEATARAGRERTPGTVYSFDMLGEAARTETDAARYFDRYARAIATLGEQANADGLSVKLSALHPRYEFVQGRRLARELYPRVLSLAEDAAKHDLAFTIDAEESERLEPSLDLFARLSVEPSLKDWPGLGIAVQAYQKRALPVLDWLAALAHETGRRIPVRLVKGAYWDREIKRAQQLGLRDYPVFTRKSATDLSYMVCAERLLADEGAFFPQFASHNAHTVAFVLALAGDNTDFEFQRLHGMGETLYDEVLDDEVLDDEVLGEHAPNINCRVYAPVGRQADLLPYLVRRLLENGANTSFVNRLLDRSIPVEEAIVDPVARMSSVKPVRHPSIALPKSLVLPDRRLAAGIDLSHPHDLSALQHELAEEEAREWQSMPLISGAPQGKPEHEIRDPSDRSKLVGRAAFSSTEWIEAAVGAAAEAQPSWDKAGGNARAAMLEKAALLIEKERAALISLLIREAGKTVGDAVGELRETVDYCRYYASEARHRFAAPMPLPGPTGEENLLSLHGRGVFACISPWNFPLAIFTGQTVAALAAGNAVAAKPAEQTPLIAGHMVSLLHAAGVPPDVLHLLPGGGDVGADLVADPRVAGVAFTGSTDVAQSINRALAARGGPIAPLIAETAGQNAMIVDSSALREQVTDDVVTSAFLSAGQRCSSLRILLLQDDIADAQIEMLCGAMDELQIGDPADPATDIGPLIDEDAIQRLDAHASYIKLEGRLIKACNLPPGCEHGTYFPPMLFEIDDLALLREEAFGPILHIKRFKREALEGELDTLRGLGYGLTLGIHSRLASTAERVRARMPAGNTYINRNMIGAVVGMQPFGGEGLSGTGPKAGGPNYLTRFATERMLSTNTAAIGGNPELLDLASPDKDA